MGFKEYKKDFPAAINIDPPNATAYDELTLTFDPEKACFQNGSLSGLSSIAIYSGIKLLTGETWQKIVSYNGTGVNGQAPILLPAGDGRFEMTFNPAAYYGLNGETVTHICAVFNNGTNWDEDGRNFIPGTSDCMDFFIPLSTSSIYPFNFNLGDGLKLVGYTEIGQITITDAPKGNKSYEFQVVPTIPSVTTSEIINITPPTATSGGNVTSSGGLSVTARGVCWSTSQNPTIADSHSLDGSGTVYLLAILTD